MKYTEQDIYLFLGMVKRWIEESEQGDKTALPYAKAQIDQARSQLEVQGNFNRGENKTD